MPTSISKLAAVQSPRESLTRYDRLNSVVGGLPSRAVTSSFVRLLLIALMVGAAILYPFQFTLVAASGTFGFSTDSGIANAPAVTRHVFAVSKDSPAWRAGLRAGDALPLANVDRASRAALDFVLPGQQARYTVRRGTRTFQVRVVATNQAPYVLDASDAIRTVVMYCLLLFALLVALRAWHTEYGPIIATMLTATVLDAAADRIPWVLWTANAAGAALFGNDAVIDSVCTAVSCLLPIYLVGRLTAWRSVAFRVTASCAAALMAFVVIYAPIGVVLKQRGYAGTFNDFAQAWLLDTLPFLATAAAIVLAHGMSHGEGRQRLRWVFWGFFPYFFGVGLFNATNNLPLTSTWYYFHPLAWEVAASTFRAMELALPIALFYGVLVRRVVDIGFVFNRVAIYGALSVTLVSAFVLLEYAASRVFLNVDRIGSFAVQIAVALIIGLSAQYLHRIVERIVDRIFFAKRNADERALHKLSREAEAYSKADALLDRVISTIREHSESRGVAIYLKQQNRIELVRSTQPDFPQSVDEDDPLMVSLRRWNEPIDTHGLATALPDGMVFPMSSRGTLIGALACETKLDSSAFDPDEREALADVSRCVASALDDLRREEGGGILQAIGEAIAGLEGRLDTKLAAIARDR